MFTDVHLRVIQVFILMQLQQEKSPAGQNYIKQE